MFRSLTVCAGLLALAAGASPAPSADKGDKAVPPALNFTMKGLDGKDVDLAQLQGKVVVIVNVASKCGYTPQYKALEALHEKYAKDGLVVLGVPANDFGKQEPGTDAEIANFCKSKYDVQFPMLSKVVVKGEGQTPLYKYLTDPQTDPKFAGPIQWNFTKFLINRKGEVVGRFEPKVKPDSPEMVEAIEKELDKK